MFESEKVIPLKVDGQNTATQFFTNELRSNLDNLHNRLDQSIQEENEQGYFQQEENNELEQETELSLEQELDKLEKENNENMMKVTENLQQNVLNTATRI